MIKTVYDGFEPSGKNIVILAGIHGNEITPVYTLMKMIKDYSLTDLTIFNKINKITLVNLINREGLEKNTRENVKNHTNDINRMFDCEDSFNYNELNDLLNDSDVIIDIHSSPCCTEFALIDINEYTNSLVKWCEISNVNYACRYSSTKTIKRYAQDLGKISLTLELNGMSTIDFKSAEKGIQIIKNLLNNLFSFEYEQTPPNINELVNISSYVSGLALHKINLGDIVEKGDLITEINDSRHNNVLSIFSPIKGRIISLTNNYISVGEAVALLQPYK